MKDSEMGGIGDQYHCLVCDAQATSILWGWQLSFN